MSRVCKKCNEKIPNRTIIDGKISFMKSRSYCLTCSPYKSKKGYDLRKGTKQKIGKICPCCNKQQTKYFKNNVCPTCRSFKTRYTRKHKLKKQFGGKCVRCNCQDIHILQFHHIDPASKLFNLSTAYNCMNYADLVEEAKKCELLCPNCHAKEHIKDNEKVLKYYKLI